MAERILLAGCGDLGQRVAQRLRNRGTEVWGLRRQPPPDTDDGIHWYSGDLTQPESLHGLPTGITHVVYLPTPARRDEAAYRDVFLTGLQHLLKQLAQAALQRVLFVSSSAVYGDHAGAWVNEDTPPNPPSFNGTVLCQAEQWLASQRLPATVLRLAGLYGPGRLQLIERIRAGQARVPRGQPHWANRIHIDDAAAAIVHLLDLPAPESLYLGVDNTPLPLDVLYDYLARLTGAPAPADGPSPPGIGSKRLDNARLRGSGFTPRWPDARDGYAALIER
ncbi:MAG: SDR family oxidoreductase [Rhodanobacter sp.]